MEGDGYAKAETAAGAFVDQPQPTLFTLHLLRLDPMILILSLF